MTLQHAAKLWSRTQSHELPYNTMDGTLLWYHYSAKNTQSTGGVEPIYKVLGFGLGDQLLVQHSDM